MKFPPTSLRSLSHRDQLGAALNAMGHTDPIVEVGTLYGEYASVLLKTYQGKVCCVDPWTNQPQNIYHDGANQQNMEHIWAHAYAKLNANPKCKLMRMLSIHGAGQFKDGELAGAYLDGNHALPNVRADINAWFPKVKVGGIFCGHDFFTRYDNDTNSDAQTAVMEFAERIGQWPHVTWCTSWFFVKTREADEAFRATTPAPKTRRSYVDTPLIAVLAVSPTDFHLAKKFLHWHRCLDGRGLVVHCARSIPEAKRAELEILMPELVTVTDEIYERGYGASANYLFRSALEMCERNYPGVAVLWCEADSVPMRATWLEEVADEYRACGKPFLGDFVKHDPPGSGIDHMTGTAVYPPDWRTVAPSIADLPGPRPDQGWDSQCSHETVPLMAQSKTIQQIWRPGKIDAHFRAKNIWSTTALFHQCKDGSLIDVLCDEAGIVRIPLEEPLAIRVESVLSPAATRMEIMIVTHRRDMDFLHYCVQSIKKYARGFVGTTIVVPKVDRHHFRWTEGDGFKLIGMDEPPGKGMMAHEVAICRADEYCPEADAILHLDADCMFWHQATPNDFMDGDRIRMLCERYSEITNPNRHIWKEVVKRSSGMTVYNDTMLRHPQVYARDVYPRTRLIVEQHTGTPFDQYVLSCESGFPQGFCEHVLLGNVATDIFSNRVSLQFYDHHQDAAAAGLVAGTFQYTYKPHCDPVVEFWSHSGISRYRQDAEKFLRGNLPKFYVK